MAPTAQASLPIDSAVLPNGLTVLLREDHAAPVAAFYVFYKVGSRNEVTGRTGLSHWVEHLLFDGTPTYPKGALHRIVGANGGYRNGFTWNDGTAFYEALPADRIELALKLESDRMVNALLDPAEVERERTVIISERQGGENYPTRHLYEEVMAAAYKVHPYGQPVIGWKSDLQSITRDELWEHYQRYYHPTNAVAVAVGDFAAPAMLAEIERYFGGIAAGPPAAPVRSVEPAQEGERRLEVRRPGGTAHLMAVYHIPAAGHPDISRIVRRRCPAHWRHCIRSWRRRNGPQFAPAAGIGGHRQGQLSFLEHRHQRRSGVVPRQRVAASGNGSPGG